MNFSQWISDYESIIRLSFFFGIFTLMACWETRQPRRTLTIDRFLRWKHNLSLVILNTLLLRFVFPTTAVGVAVFAHVNGWGLLNYVSAHPLITIPISIMLLDCIIYLQHVMMHAVPLFWRLHQVHHADLDFDVTTGFRFHPIEILVSMLIKFCAIITLGPPIVAVIIFEVLLNGTAMFNHSNIRIPKHIDRWLRLILVTPDMHRVHHSTLPKEANSNFGFNLPWWDRLFGTYLPQPAAGHTKMEIGLAKLRNTSNTQPLWAMLKLPFTTKETGYDINERVF